MRFAILALLGVRPAHGYALRSELDELIGDFWSVNQGQVYATLERLTSAELIAPADADEHPAGSRRVQRLAPRGEECLRAWLARPSIEIGRRSELSVRIALCVEGQELLRLRELIAAQRRRCASLARSLGSSPSSVRARAGALARRAALSHVEAELAWLDLVEQELLGADCSPHP